MREIWALAVKDLKLLIRDRAGLFFTFFFPILYAVFFGVIMGGMGSSEGREGTPILVIDQDHSKASEAFVASLEADSQLRITRSEDRAEAETLVKDGKQTAFVVVPGGFGDSSKTIFKGEPIRLIVGVDPSHAAEAGLIQGLITAKAYERLQDLFMSPASARQMARDAMAEVDKTSDMSPVQKTIMKSFLGSLDSFMKDMPAAGGFGGTSGEGGGAGFNPIQIETVDLATDKSGKAMNAFAITFPQGIVWGVMGCTAGFGISLVSERNKGTLTRLQTSPLSRSRVLLGKALACFLATVGVAVLLLVVARLFFGVHPQSLPMLALAVFCVAVAFVGIMMLLSTIGKTEASSGGIGWAVLLVCAMFGGGMIPLMFMKGWMVTLSNFSPVKWSIYAIEGAVWRGFTFDKMLLPCGILLAIGVVGFAAGSRLFAWSEG
ncbi:MAG: ABC transporter permease [Phycisphaerales bacterium]|nr:ABC transporter permease [Phycisphaerales bacterium]